MGLTSAGNCQKFSRILQKIRYFPIVCVKAQGGGCLHHAGLEVSERHPLSPIMFPALAHQRVDPLWATPRPLEPESFVEDGIPELRIVGNVAIWDLSTAEYLPQSHPIGPHVTALAPPPGALNFGRHVSPRNLLFGGGLLACGDGAPEVCDLDPDAACAVCVERVDEDVAGGDIPVDYAELAEAGEAIDDLEANAQLHLVAEEAVPYFELCVEAAQGEKLGNEPGCPCPSIG